MSGKSLKQAVTGRQQSVSDKSKQAAVLDTLLREAANHTRIHPKESRTRIEDANYIQIEDGRYRQTEDIQAEHSSHIRRTLYTQPAEHSTAQSTVPNRALRQMHQLVVGRVHMTGSEERLFERRSKEGTFVGSR